MVGQRLRDTTKNFSRRRYHWEGRVGYEQYYLLYLCVTPITGWRRKSLKHLERKR